jgi:cellulose synthase/poly-beta-1,6-N-acetylglucosamine synthase-like glycosyltransferase
MTLVFWAAAGLVGYTYFGYAAWLWLRSRWHPRPVRSVPYTPSISIILVVRNEATCLEAKLRNLLELNYPHERAEIVVVSDGSTDDTNRILQEFADTLRVRVILSAEARGKAAGLNDAMKAARAEIVVFTDARQKIEPDSVRLLLENFADPGVGCASGELILGDPGSGESAQGMGLYWKIEKAIRVLESASGSVVGATGALYAIRRNLLLPIPPDTILDDVFLPMNVVRQGLRVVFDPRARVWDRPDLGTKREFARKVRTLSGNYQLLQQEPWLLTRANPMRFAVVSHKLLRLAMPFALAATLITSCFLSGPAYRVALIAQLVFYSLSAGAFVQLKDNRLARVPKAAFAFVLLNTAAVVAFANFVAGRKAAWVR